MKRTGRVLPGLLLSLCLLLSGCAPAREPGPTPEAPPTPGSERVDTTRLDRGVVSVRYEAPNGGRLKVQLTREGGKPYNYDLNTEGNWEVFPLTEGDGVYTLKVLEQIQDSRYRAILTQTLELTLADPLSPFLLPNQFVNYGPDLADLAEQVMGSGETDADKTALALDYVVERLTYDEDKADAVEPGYLPDLAAILDEGRGICFDYAALLCAMLRSQGIPAKLVIGDSGEVYHAWVEVWCETAGEAGGIPITPGEWALLDPTFLSESGDDPKILDYVQNRENYAPRYFY